MQNLLPKVFEEACLCAFFVFRALTGRLSLKRKMVVNYKHICTGSAHLSTVGLGTVVFTLAQLQRDSGQVNAVKQENIVTHC